MPKLWMASFFAGVFISMGAFCSQVAYADIGLKAASAAVFPIGLIMVVLGKTELFTGNHLLAYSFYARNEKLSAVIKNWSIVYVGNLLGCLIFGACIVVGYSHEFTNSRVAEVITTTAATKAGLHPLDMFIRGILCNILVCLAVWCAYQAKTVTGKAVAIFCPIFLFVYCGFEHSIANMFFIPVGMAVHLLGDIGPHVPFLGLLSNFLFVSLGNIVGGAGIAAGGLWVMDFHALKKDRERKLEELLRQEWKT